MKLVELQQPGNIEIIYAFGILKVPLWIMLFQPYKCMSISRTLKISEPHNCRMCSYAYTNGLMPLKIELHQKKKKNTNYEKLCTCGLNVFIIECC